MDRTRRLRQTAVMRSMVRGKSREDRGTDLPAFLLWKGKISYSRWNPCRASASIPLTA